MPFASGVYTWPSNTFTPTPTANTTISASDATSSWSDAATALSSCLLKDGSQTVTANIPMAGFKFTGLGAGSAAGNSLRYEQLFTTSAVTLLGAMDWVKGADIASAATTNLTTATGNAVHITGTTSITAVTLGSGMWRLLIFDSALTLTHHATNNNLPGGANITTAANDRALYWSDGTTVYCTAYQRASGGIITSATAAEQETGTSATQPVTPSIQQRHASASKGWTMATFGGASTVGYNINSITDTGTGQITVVWETDFSSDNYCVQATVKNTAASQATLIVPEVNATGQVAGSVLIDTLRASDAAAIDATNLFVTAFGDQ